MFCIYQVEAIVSDITRLSLSLFLVPFHTLQLDVQGEIKKEGLLVDDDNFGQLNISLSASFLFPSGLIACKKIPLKFPRQMHSRGGISTHWSLLKCQPGKSYLHSSEFANGPHSSPTWFSLLMGASMYEEVSFSCARAN